MAEIKSIVESLRKEIGDDEQIACAITNMMYEHKLTKQEFDSIIHYMGLDFEKTQAILIAHFNSTHNVRKDLTIEDIPSMNYQEVLDFAENKKKKGISEKSLINEVFKRYAQGLVSKRDTEYFLQILGYNLEDEEENN